MDRSASSTILWEPPLTRSVSALGFFDPSMKTHLSSSIFLSSARPAVPRSFFSKSSMLVTILPPVAFASLLISLSLTRLTARIFSLAKKCCATSSIPFWHTRTFAPTEAILLTMSLSSRFSSSRNFFICSGALILISAENSVFSISRGAFIIAMRAFLILLGIPA